MRRLLIGLLLCAAVAAVWHAATYDPLAARAGELLIAGFRGVALAPDHHVFRDISDYGLGGVVLYEYDAPSSSRPRNVTSPAQLRALTAALQEAAADAGRPPLIIAIDQEGGRVNRLRQEYGFPPTLSAQALGTLDDAETTAYWADLTAQALADAGITLNFAPVVDLNRNPASPAIGAVQRSFSAVPDTVARHARAFIAAHHARGISCALKHFPGHGSATADSHFGLTDVTATWQREELLPYAQVRADAVMSAHTFNTRLDTQYPATLSMATLGGLLRGELGWQGPVISDDMMMGAITQQYGRAEAIALALNAGCDLLIFSNNTAMYEPDIVPEVVDIIRAHLASGRISRQTLKRALDNASCLRTSHHTPQ